ncbi:aldo/keto reductase [Marinactinospora thermotolerans]|uniref:Aryl-alcohol dehydrogenase (NADP+) n=1 Tax=Marinactinospora thermotolerans DSM 45154 TaxID=1122192 RepID=A0A1T4NRH8_9ACTN|nr:aldo/keto reductase [Marinactinospora thermotolerans]SJZ81794.1 aryl-alcohol dehydrogenase (NADP+) [Marinactinospora thermotolerans DSM 45154]
MKQPAGSDLRVHPLVLGGNVFGWTSDVATSHRILDAFVEGGGTLVDTADSYSVWAPGHSGGESEEVIGAWLARRGSRDVAIATKVGQHPQFRGLGADNVVAAAEASLTRLGMEAIDLYYAHIDDEDTPLEETVGAFDRLVREGKVRHMGLSDFRAERVDAWVETAARLGAAPPVALQPEYSLVRRDVYEPDLLAAAGRHGLRVMPYFALASGFLTGKYRTEEDLATAPRGPMAKRYLTSAGLRVVDVLADVAEAHSTQIATIALAWVLARPHVSAVPAGASRPGQLPALLEAARVRLTEEEMDALTRASEAVSRR